MPKKQKGHPIYKQYVQENFDKAILAVQNGSLSQRKAADAYNIPQATLSDHLRGRVKEGATAGRQPVFPLKVEKLIADKCQVAAEMGLGMSKLQVLQKAGQIAKAMKIKTSFNKNNIPGKDWWHGFKTRNPTVSLRAPEKLTSVRARGPNVEKVGNYLLDLQKYINEFGLEAHPECIWNMDEKGISMEHAPVKVVAAKHSRCIPGRVNNSRESNTIIACINANGDSMNPLIIVKGKTEKSLWGFNTSQGPSGAKWTYQQNAWTEDILGVEWFRNIFVKECGSYRPQLLILDGHHSHEVLGLIEAAVENNIHIIALPPHTTHYLCPLDRCVFGPLSSQYNLVCSEFSQDPRNVINKMSWPGLLCQAYNRAFTKENIIAGFRACGIVPWNPLAIPREAFLPSLAFDNRPILAGDEHPLQWVMQKARVQASDVDIEVNIAGDITATSTTPSFTANKPVQTEPSNSSATLNASDDSLYMNESSVSLLLPVVDNEVRDAIESLIALEGSNETSISNEVVTSLDITPSDTNKIIDLPLVLNVEPDTYKQPNPDTELPPTIAEWNASVESIFSVASPPPKKARSGKNTSHRLLTSESILNEKRKVEQMKQRKEFEKENRQKQKDLIQAKKLIEGQLKELRNVLAANKVAKT